MTRTRKTILGVVASVSVAISINHSDAADLETPKEVIEHEKVDGLFDYLFGGDLNVELRYRYQFIDEEAFVLDAHASTIRALVKYQTKPLYGVSFLGEIRAVQNLATDDLFNNTLNGVTNRPVIADPEAAEIDQAHLIFDDVVPDTKVTVGRRKIALNNQRFISTLPFRQNANSFDGVVIENTAIPNTYLHYSYARNFNRAFTDDSPVGNFSDSNFHLIHGEYSANDYFKGIGYAYLLGIDESSFPGASNLATNNFGFNVKGSVPITDKWTFHYDAEYANQSDNSENANDFNLNYFRIQPGISYDNLRLNAGYEVLGGDGVRGFSTPLALLHAFNGYADIFVVTPPDGLQDAYVNLTYKFKPSKFKIGGYDLLGGTTLHLAGHYFAAEDSNTSYGFEFDASIKKKLRENAILVFEYAHYEADFDGPVTTASPRFTRDTDQFFTQLILKF